MTKQISCYIAIVIKFGNERFYCSSFFYIYIYITYCIGLICTKTEKEKKNKTR